MGEPDQDNVPVLGTGAYASEAIDEMSRRLKQLRAENETLRAEVDRLREDDMTKVYLLSTADHDGCEVHGIFTSRADAERIQPAYEYSEIEEWDLDELAGREVVTEWVARIRTEDGRIYVCEKEFVFGDADFVPFGRHGARFDVRSRTSAEHAMKVAEEESRKWIAVLAAEKSVPD